MVKIKVFFNDGHKQTGTLGNKYMNGIDFTDDATNEVLFIPLTSFKFYILIPEERKIRKPSPSEYHG